MVIPITYRKNTEGVLTSYNYVDIESGLGYVTFYPVKTSNSWTLSDRVLKSEGTESSWDVTYNSNTYTSSGALYTFNTSTFNLPKIVKGTAYVEIDHYYKCNSTADLVDFAHSFAILKNGSVIGFSSGAAYQSLATGATSSGSLLIGIDIPETNFKRGDYLGIAIRPVGRTQSAGTSGSMLFSLGNDPYDRDGTYLKPSTTERSTIFKVDIPFKIDL